MASNSTTNSVVRILERPEDWEAWIWQIRAEIAQILWPCIDPNLPDDEIKPLLDEPVKPRYQDVNAVATTYAGLTTAQQKTYHDLRSYYSEDLKLYQR